MSFWRRLVNLGRGAVAVRRHESDPEVARELERELERARPLVTPASPSAPNAEAVSPEPAGPAEPPEELDELGLPKARKRTL
ncbi:MAG: hypothetical protein H6739_41485 [Alphaproteobacteria bacterium]|nr:hypothetical protein [Alphaproteobacteria bacterium]